MILLVHCFVLMLISPFHWVHAQSIPNNGRLLNAYNAPLTELTSPKTYYFLEFPLPGTPGGSSNAWEFPMCADESPFSFIFRRGTDAHLKKLIVEFEGGPACTRDVDADSNTFCDCVSNGKRRTDWYNYTLKQGTGVGSSSEYTFPSLGICTGVPPGFIRQGEEIIFGKNEDRDDVPLFLRWENKKRGWWNFLSGDVSDVDDWSYIFVPHCTLDWHLGRQTTPAIFTGCPDATTLHHRGGFNVEAVLDWVTNQFSPLGGLDALVTVSGGKLGGCLSSNNDGIPTSSASSIASLTFAQDASSEGIIPRSSALAIMDGASLWHDDVQYKYGVIKNDFSGSKELMQSVASSIAMASAYVNVLWVSSQNYDPIAANEEKEWLSEVKEFVSDSFHVYKPPISGETDTRSEQCPAYAFPNESLGGGFSDFIRVMTSSMPWSSVEPAENSADNGNGRNSKKEISFFSIALITVGLLVISWGIFIIVKRRRLAKNLPIPPSPNDLWFKALTRYPFLFFIVSLFIPTLLSLLAFSSEGYRISVNLDFDSYLDIDTKEERLAEQYEEFKNYHYKQVTTEETNCRKLYRGFSGDVTFATNRLLQRRSLKDSLTLDRADVERPFINRSLQSFGVYGKPRPNQVIITFFYQNRNGGNVFEPTVLEAIRDFEQSIMNFPGFDDYCYGFEECFPLDSLIPFLFPDGETIVDDIDSILRGFLGTEMALSKVDKFFGRDNLASNVTMSQVWFDDDIDQNELEPFLEKLYEMLWSTDQQRKYPDMVFTWGNSYMETLESNEALNHDALWSSASIIFIGLMVFFKVQNIFVATSAVLCLVLAFTSALYWCEHHFVFKELTMMHVAGLFVMLGIGADDIFLTIDTFDHTKVEYTDDSNSKSHLRSYEEPDAIRERMITSYKIAGSMMLVSSLTTAICFFSNSFGVLTAIRDFGTYMGMVVLLNYVHVMTILPSSILVYELHISPFKRNFLNRMKANQSEKRHLGESDALGNTNICLRMSLRDQTQMDESFPAVPPNAHHHQRDDELCDDSSEYCTVEKQPDSNVDVTSIDGIINDDKVISPSNEGHNDEENQNESFLDICDHTAETGVMIRNTNLPHDYTQEKSTHDSWHDDSQNHAEDERNRDYYFLDCTHEMTALDKWFVRKYSPFIYRWRIIILLISLVTAITLGVLAVKNFSLYDGTIVVFKEKYNLGRLQRIGDLYFNEELVKIFQEQSDSLYASASGTDGSGSNAVGSENTVSESNGQNSLEDPELVTTETQSNVPQTPTPTASSTTTYLSGFPSVPSTTKSVSPDEYPSPSPSFLPSLVLVSSNTTNDTAFGADTPELDSDELSYVIAPTTRPTSAGDDAGVWNPLINTTTTNVPPPSSTTEATSIMTTSTSAQWYWKLNPDWQNGYCTNELPIPSDQNMLFETQAQCCSIIFYAQPSHSCLIDAGLYTESTTTITSSTSNVATTTIQTSCLINDECDDDKTCSDGRCVISSGSIYNILLCKAVECDIDEYCNEATGECVQDNDLGGSAADNHTQIPVAFPTPIGIEQTITISPSAEVSTPMTSTDIQNTILSQPFSTLSPTRKTTTFPTLISISTPSITPTFDQEELNCPEGWQGTFCLPNVINGMTDVLQQRELFVVSMVWGMETSTSKPSVWMVETEQEPGSDDAAITNSEPPKGSNLVDPSEPEVQEWLLKIITFARNDVGLQLMDEITWIEALEKFAIETGIGFPLPKELFLGTVQLLKSQSNFFRILVKREIATDSPGITGNFLYTSISVLSEVPMTKDSWSAEALAKWSNFTDFVNGMLPDDMPPLVLQSSSFLDSQRSQATVDSTVTTYFVANGLCLLVILLFTSNILLTLMIMVTLLLIFFCLGGLLFNVFMIEFGPVEALGVSIFVGLSANYSLHVAHAFHNSSIKDRTTKIQRTAFVTGSPILASAVSTIGGSAFLLACRTWLLTELGILICAIIALSLFFSMLFLLAWLATFGPLPREVDSTIGERNGRVIHSWDLINIFLLCSCSRKFR
eukprot:CAMPEP_0171333544 /NCGR_PEP_ID=MMETSP0878-20121228/4072_1 /TAXON_ID=67004 /ORGANISM="Thalassiosira weissflogii, Strain CCMP1336" /LENGTH=2008 /DNA_ID=CAMNT_0011834491 /DNA_START=127 /DNA_END=6153 /DNA_ORIENTATION=-